MTYISELINGMSTDFHRALRDPSPDAEILRGTLEHQRTIWNALTPHARRQVAQMRRRGMTTDRTGGAL